MLPEQGVALHQFIKIACPSNSPKRVSRIATRGIPHNTKLTKKLSQKIPAPQPYTPPQLGKSAKRLASRENSVGFFQACVEARGPHEINQLPPNPHPATALLDHMQVHGVPIKIERDITDDELTRAIRYGAQSSATKETTFVRTELQEQSQAGHILLFPLTRRAPPVDAPNATRPECSPPSVQKNGMSLVAIPVTLLGEVEGHSIFLN